LPVGVTASMRAASAYAEQVGVAYGQDDQVACIFGGEFGALEVVLRAM